MQWLPDEADRAFVAQQFGRMPRTGVSVVLRCEAGHPCVVQCYPLVKRGDRLTPWPTLYWLVCPAICQQLATLERDGAIRRIETILQSDEALAEQLAVDHERYVSSRWGALSEADRERVASSPALMQVLRDRGIAGMVNWRAVKCLHAHYGQHLVDGNTVGQLVDRLWGPMCCG